MLAVPLWLGEQSRSPSAAGQGVRAAELGPEERCSQRPAELRCGEQRRRGWEEGLERRRKRRGGSERGGFSHAHPGRGLHTEGWEAAPAALQKESWQRCRAGLVLLPLSLPPASLFSLSLSLPPSSFSSSSSRATVPPRRCRRRSPDSAGAVQPPGPVLAAAPAAGMLPGAAPGR